MANFFPNYYRYYRPNYSSNNFKNSHEVEPSPPMEDEKKEKSSNTRSFGPLHFKIPFFNDDFDIEKPIFEILGIELYLDDIIILGLLFFLYKEGVQDEMLFIALILLLLG